MRARALTALLGGLLLGLLPGAARADAVSPPPDACPPGSVPSTSHAGPHCRPAPACALSATCDEGLACETVGLCIEQVPCGGRLPVDAGPCFEGHVVGTCSTSGTCSTGTCELQSVCVPPSSGQSGCACRAGGGDAGWGLAALGAIALSLVLRRR